MDDRHPSCKPIGTSACPNRHARASRGKSSIDSTGRRTIEMLAAQHAKPNAQEPKRLQASKNSAYTRQTQRVSPRMPAATGGEPVADRSTVYGLCHSRYRARPLHMHSTQKPLPRTPCGTGEYCPGYTLSQSVSCSVGHGTRICAATAPPRAELDFAPTAREQDRPRSTTAKNVIAEIGSLLEPLWKLEARISPWIRRICAAQAPIRNVATPPSRR